MADRVLKVTLSAHVSAFLPGMRWELFKAPAVHLSRLVPVPVWVRSRSTVQGREPGAWRTRVLWIFRGRRMRRTERRTPVSLTADVSGYIPGMDAARRSGGGGE